MAAVAHIRPTQPLSKLPQLSSTNNEGTGEEKKDETKKVRRQKKVRKLTPDDLINNMSHLKNEMKDVVSKFEDGDDTKKWVEPI